MPEQVSDVRAASYALQERAGVEGDIRSCLGTMMGLRPEQGELVGGQHAKGIKRTEAFQKNAKEGKPVGNDIGLSLMHNAIF